MKKIIIAILLTLTFIKFTKPMDIWKDKNYNFLDYDEVDDRCDNEICQNNFDDLIKRKVKDNEDMTYQSDVIGKKTTRLSPYYHPSRPMPCSCGIEFRVLDLGHQYYPRYLHSGVCKSELCGGPYRCIERHYKVRVLKQKDPRNPEIRPSMALPDTLKGTWLSETITVTVACECSV
ncbi:prothoracicotropic hormone [Tribolium castaneum]|uniref:prothoracicotropic hormone n=1 Tax=Tribolium castaneum TaxID=7070 RepID=UPI00077DA92B|nr:PREDICTED: prothoracicotropic hormone isoform X1 [Tribolium castaneum]|eukprot:XP_015840872.1 PREDICTED: prothoracicotropic hormone isoform X1 [Tribolium castaneum]